MARRPSWMDPDLVNPAGEPLDSANIDLPTTLDDLPGDDGEPMETARHRARREADCAKPMAAEVVEAAALGWSTWKRNWPRERMRKRMTPRANDPGRALARPKLAPS